jgi:chemotaxis protein MotB
MPRKHVHDEHLNHEAWAIPYGDLMTLLLAFFVTMYAMSSVNTGKYRVLSNSLNAAFRGDPHSAQPIQVGEPSGGGAGSQMPIDQVNQMIAAGMPTNMRVLVPAPGAVPEGQSAPARTQQLNAVEVEVSASLADLMRTNAVRIQRRGNNLEVQISTDVLFASGEAEPSLVAVNALKSLAQALKPWPNAVRVEGHTDNVPIRTASFRSNWELSAARAASVVRLLADNGLAPQRMTVVGFGEFTPIQDNATASGRNANRRVMIMILGRDGGPAASGAQ